MIRELFICDCCGCEIGPEPEDMTMCEKCKGHFCADCIAIKNSRWLCWRCGGLDGIPYRANATFFAGRFDPDVWVPDNVFVEDGEFKLDLGSGSTSIKEGDFLVSRVDKIGVRTIPMSKSMFKFIFGGVQDGETKPLNLRT